MFSAWKFFLLFYYRLSLHESENFICTILSRKLQTKSHCDPISQEVCEDGKSLTNKKKIVLSEWCFNFIANHLARAWLNHTTLLYLLFHHPFILLLNVYWTEVLTLALESKKKNIARYFLLCIELLPFSFLYFPRVFIKKEIKHGDKE